jgi:hypothetical protein
MRVRILFVTIVAFAGACDSNAKPTYGDTGLPKNCRAIIQANVDGWRSGKWSAENALDSIERNCGAQGYSWGN